MWPLLNEEFLSIQRLLLKHDDLLSDERDIVPGILGLQDRIDKLEKTIRVLMTSDTNED